MIRFVPVAVIALVSPALALDLPKADAIFAAQDMGQVQLGQLLFYDPILSGNRNISCATCHHPRFGTGDGLSLGLGEGATGLGPDRVADPGNLPEQRIPRHSPALFNLGASEFTSLFHDGRLEADATRPSGIRTPLGADMEAGFASVLSAQTMFPVLSADEMAGHYSENEIAQAVRQGFITGEGGAWDLLSQRIEDIPEYRLLFDAVIGAEPIHFTDISDAIAAFVAFEWRADDSAFDRYLRDSTPLPDDAQAGLEIFYGEAGCSSCHSGQFQTDHGYHAIAMPQVGPGKAARFERHNRDIGRQRVTGAEDDAYAFRTPSLRNVTFTAPYGHTGSFATLKGVIRHHLDPATGLAAYDPAQLVLPELANVSDLSIVGDAMELEEIIDASDLTATTLADAEIDQIIAFLRSLEDPKGLTGRLGVPATVPSGLSVDQ